LLDRSDYDGPVIEAPSMYRSSEGVFFLFFASNCYTSDLYSTSYATADNVLGPYTRVSTPLLFSGSHPGLIGPGGLDVVHRSYAEELGESEVDSRMVVFHSHMAATHTNDDRKQAPFGHIGPLMRGMYSAMAHFEGREVRIEMNGDGLASDLVKRRGGGGGGHGHDDDLGGWY
ncbi:hypothetical protein LTR66_017278, partial [Elasticomyces elasticus]